MIPYNGLPIISVSVVLSLATYLLTPRVGRKLKKMRIVGIDVHKASMPRIPERGGLILLASVLAFLGCVFCMTGWTSLLFVMACTASFGAYGVLDDMKRLGKYEKLGLSAGIGFAVLLPLNPALAFMPILLLLTMGLGNVFNLFAGFNGLEMGSSAIVAACFSVLCLLTGNVAPFYLSFGAFLILLAFLMHNRYPARIFPGNVGTFTVGGFFVGICLYYNLLYLIIPLLALHIADMALKAMSAGYFSSHEKLPTRVNGDNVLVPGDDFTSLSRLVLKVRPMTEKQLVWFFWGALSLIGASVIMVTGALL